jgi:hypothetical protein
MIWIALHYAAVLACAARVLLRPHRGPTARVAWLAVLFALPVVNGGEKTGHRGGAKSSHRVGWRCRLELGERLGARAPHKAGACQGASARQGRPGRGHGSGLFGFPGAALGEPIAGAVHLEDVDVVCQPVEKRAGEAFVAECAGPRVEGQVGGDDRGAALV